jgi:hypothetical protein
MENKEKFAFRNVNMSQGVEVEFIKLLTSLETKSDLSHHTYGKHKS